MPVMPTQPATPEAATRIVAALDLHLDQALFRALSDATRLRVFSALVKVGRPCTASELAACCQVDFSVVNKHLKVLVEAEVLAAAKEGRSVWYQARCADLCDRLHALIEAIAAWCPNLAGEGGSGPRSCCAPVGED
ncbi:MAG: winged helix-turn-helix transcriptional regulator [Planctomycetes bacterium]|nr:winged helix-turn-helix transcriptional regulator [Planctomycetota bacterium]